MKQKYNLLAFATFSVAAIATAYAAISPENDALAIASAKVGLTQAVTSAEQYIGGKAARAEYEQHKGQWVFDVEVVKGGQVMDVKVDAASGKVISAAEDKTDRDDKHDKAD
ncbi:MAG: PepSY domain-containing protein [Gallionella sp.]|jgi:uncharacterized membrane protein YkoI|nr:PepSY domain-containing protein [Gallionella sp.]